MSTSTGSPYEEMRLRCGFGRLGLCCTDCLRGPCRLSPFDDGAGRGLCGRDIDAIVAYQVARLFAGGLASLLAEPPDDAPSGAEERSLVRLVAALGRTGEEGDWQDLLSQAREMAGRIVAHMTLAVPPASAFPPIEALNESLRTGRVAGLALLVDSGACPEETIELAREMLRAGMLCFLAGPASPELEASGMLSEDAPAAAGRGVGPFLKEYGLPAVMFAGYRDRAGAVLAYARALGRRLPGERPPLVAAFPGLAEPTLAAIGLGLAAQGVAGHAGAALPAGGSAAVMEWLASPPRYSGIAPIFTSVEPITPRQIVDRLLAWLERP